MSHWLSESVLRMLLYDASKALRRQIKAAASLALCLTSSRLNVIYYAGLLKGEHDTAEQQQLVEGQL